MTKDEMLAKVKSADYKKKKVKNTHIKISNNIVEAKLFESNLLSLKTLLYIAMIDKDIDFKNTTETVYTLSLEHIKHTFDVDNQVFRQNINSMLESSIVFSDNDNEYHAISLLNEISIDYTLKTMTIHINNKILKEVINLKNKYTLIEHKTAFQLKNKHSLKIYTILARIAGYDEDIAKKKVYSLEELNLLLGTNYKTYSQFKINVLDKVCKELDKVSDISFVCDKNIIKKDLIESKIRNIGFEFYLKNNKNRQSSFDF